MGLLERRDEESAPNSVGASHCEGDAYMTPNDRVERRHD
jgi:hypothetical protein